jgi:uncharacterized lipoprotein YajG
VRKLILIILLLFHIYSQGQDIYIDSIKNNIPTGPITANKNLGFGMKNILGEALQEKGYNLTSEKNLSALSLTVEIYFFDIVQTNAGVSVFKKQNNTTVIGIKGNLYKNGKLINSKKVEEASTEVVIANLIISEDGKPNQQSVSNVLKKSCQTLIDKLL